MTGEDLYNLWVEAMGLQGIRIDEDWSQVDDAEQAAWEDVAKQVVSR